VAQTIAFLGEYVVIHFRDEEKLMQKHNFPGYVNHKGLHDGFIKGFHELNDQLEKEGPGLSLVLKTNRMVVDWLVRHISKENKEFGEFLRGEG
jgi:hemerythrin